MFFGLSLHGWENWMVGSLVVAGAFALIAGLSTWAVVRLQRIEIAESKEDFDRYKLEAIARIKEAELKTEQLRKELGPRHLQRDVFLKTIAESPKSKVEIMYLMDDPECFDLTQQIWRGLEDAAWPVVPPRPIPPLIISDSPTAMSVDGQPSGVTVVSNGITLEESEASLNAMQGKPWVRTPLTVLMQALGASIGKISGHAGGPNRPPQGILRVVVAPR